MKSTYRIQNWSDYNQGLKQRGSLTVWMDASVLDSWIIPRAVVKGHPFTTAMSLS